MMALNTLKREAPPSDLAESNKRRRLPDAPGTETSLSTFVDTPAGTSASTQASPNVAPSLITATEQPQKLVWSKNQQSLCDCQTHYKAHEGGTYNRSKQVRGYRVGGYQEPRDVVEPDCIITCVGGSHVEAKHPITHKKMPDPQNPKKKILVRLNTKPVAAGYWENTMEKQEAVLGVIDHQHNSWKSGEIDLAPIPMDQEEQDTIFALVLGGYLITHMWQEMVKPHEELNAYPVWKIKLQRVGADPPIWWKNNNPNARIHSPQPTCTAQVCSDCQKSSPQVFQNTPWLCLNYGCREFFCANGRKLNGNEAHLEYSQEFMNWTKPLPYGLVLPNWFPPLPNDSSDLAAGSSEDSLYTGMVCPDCGCCSRRKLWDAWVCDHCGFKHGSKFRHVAIEEVDAETEAHNAKLGRSSKTFQEDGVTYKIDEDFVDKSVVETDDFTVTTYAVKDKNGQLIGSLVHSRPSQAVKEAENGADDLFTEMQETDDLHLQRNVNIHAGGHREVLCDHFSANFGVAYKFRVEVPNRAFKDAPNVVLKSLVMSSFYGEQAVKATQTMVAEGDYTHVAGSDIMKPRKDYNEVLALAYRKQNKINWHDDGEEQLDGLVTTASCGSPAVMGLRLNGENKVILRVQMRHGDVITMCGTQLQALTKHEVVPAGNLRFALTARTINIGHYEDQEMQDEMREASKIPANARDFAFQGVRLSPDFDEDDKA